MSNFDAQGVAVNARGCVRRRWNGEATERGPEQRHWWKIAPDRVAGGRPDAVADEQRVAAPHPVGNEEIQPDAVGRRDTRGTVAAHGTQSYFGAVEDPFHLRLQGKYDSFDDGAGITFHPLADGTLTPQDKRLAFVAAASGQIEVVDIAYYSNRARLMLKHPIYGPIRASLPMPGDPPDVILKLFAVSTDGLIVIDLTSSDIKPGP